MLVSCRLRGIRADIALPIPNTVYSEHYQTFIPLNKQHRRDFKAAVVYKFSPEKQGK